MASTSGRRVVVPLTNKSGGGVIAGDVVVVDGSNDDSFTTTTTGAYTGSVGVAQETIASNAVGRVAIAGAVALINVNASVTRGQYGKTHTVAKQATGSATRTVGTFCQFTTGGTTPEAILYPVDLLGSSLTDPTTTRGDTLYRNASNVLDRLAIPAAGQVLGRSGSDLAAIYPPGYQWDYATSTASDPAVTATTAGTANTLCTGSAVTYDGAAVVASIYCPACLTGSGTQCRLVLYEDGSLKFDTIGWIGGSSGQIYGSPRIELRFTPSAGSHTYSVRAYVSSGTTTFFRAGAATSCCDLRIVKA